MSHNIFSKVFVSQNDQDIYNILHNDDFSTVNNFSDESNVNILCLEEISVKDYNDNGNIELAMKKNFSYNSDSDNFSEMNLHENNNNMSGEGLYFKSNNDIENCNYLPVNNIENSQENKKELSKFKCQCSLISCKECYIKWRLKHNFCPACRKNLNIIDEKIYKSK